MDIISIESSHVLKAINYLLDVGNDLCLVTDHERVGGSRKGAGHTEWWNHYPQACVSVFFLFFFCIFSPKHYYRHLCIPKGGSRTQTAYYTRDNLDFAS